MTGRPKFDATISLGHVLTVFSLLIAGAAGFTKLQVSIAELQLEVQHSGDRISELKKDVDRLEREFHQLQLRQASR